MLLADFGERLEVEEVVVVVVDFGVLDQEVLLLALEHEFLEVGEVGEGEEGVGDFDFLHRARGFVLFEMLEEELDVELGVSLHDFIKQDRFYQLLVFVENGGIFEFVFFRIVEKFVVFLQELVLLKFEFVVVDNLFESLPYTLTSRYSLNYCYPSSDIK